jgi:hypothetical protein
MVRNRRQWMIGILFWAIFLTSLWFGMDGNFTWMDGAWAVFRFGTLAMVSILALVAYHRARKNPIKNSYDGAIWHFLAPFFMDEEDIEKRRKLSKISG